MMLVVPARSPGAMQCHLSVAARLKQMFIEVLLGAAGILPESRDLRPTAVVTSQVLPSEFLGREVFAWLPVLMVAGLWLTMDGGMADSGEFSLWIRDASPEEISSAILSVDPAKGLKVAGILMVQGGRVAAERVERVVGERRPGEVAMDVLSHGLRGLLRH